MNLLTLFRKIRPFVRPYRLLVAVTLILTLVGALMQQVNAIVLDRTVDAINALIGTDFTWNSAARIMTVISIVLLGKEVLLALVNFAQNYFGERMRIFVSRDLSQSVIEKVLTFRMAYFSRDENATGKVQARIDQGVSSLSRTVQNFFIDLLPLFTSALLALILMVCAGASELSMAQWASAYTEAALGFSKSVGDLIGPCMFAVTMGVSRVIYGKYGAKINLNRYMIASGILCLCCYLLASLSSSPVLALIGCIFCGFSVGIMWPGTISITSPRLPQGGTALFAFLAMAGDLGGAFGPSLVGTVSQQAGDSLQSGMLAGSLFPLVLIVSLLLLGRNDAKKQAVK